MKGSQRGISGGPCPNKEWSIGSLDVRTAFLYAELDDEEDGIFLVQPPAILVRMNLVKPGVLWKLKKALYGLRCAPKKWGQTRYVTLQHSECVADNMKGTVKQCARSRGVWTVIFEGRVVAYFIVYVDDVLVRASTKWLLGVMNVFKQNWECKVVGIIVKDSVETEYAVPSLVFLSITIEPIETGWYLHQHEYLEGKLRQRGVTTGRPGLPEVIEGKTPVVTPEYKLTEEYKCKLNLVQKEVGALQWLALKTRPDIAAITAICSSMQTRDPERAYKITQEIWKYLWTTKNLVMKLVTVKTGPDVVTISADASFAPGGDRSRTGVAILVNGVIVHWCSTRQSLASTSAHEAELNATTTGLKLGISLRDLLLDMMRSDVKLELDQDNLATIRSITYEVTSWRTRHYALRAAWVRDMVQQEKVDVKHVKGVDITADPLTKVLERIKLGEAREKLQLYPR